MPSGDTQATAIDQVWDGVSSDSPTCPDAFGDPFLQQKASGSGAAWFNRASSALPEQEQLRGPVCQTHGLATRLSAYNNQHIPSPQVSSERHRNSAERCLLPSSFSIEGSTPC